MLLIYFFLFFFSEGVEVSVVYYRAGYEPDHYSCDSDWESRLLIERSNAIKCPRWGI